MASLDPGPDVVAVDALDVYWAGTVYMEPGSLTAVGKTPLNGSATITLASLSQNFIGAIALDAANVYWTSATGVLMKLPRAGGTPTTMAVGGLNSSSGVAVDSTGAYWGGHFLDAGVRGEWIMKFPDDGGAAIALAPGPSAFLALDSRNLYWTAGGVMKVPLTGAPSVVVAGERPPSSYLVVDDTSAYWAEDDGSSERIMKVPLGGGAVTTLAAEGEAPPGQGFEGIAVDGTSVYWTDGVAGTVLKLTPK
jgi:hypothetical protein